MAKERAVTAETLGAWVLKANPDIYPIVDWIRHSPDVPIESWSVQDNYRSAMMQPGQPVYFWVSGDGRKIEPGIWGYGTITAPCEPDVADDEWLDKEAAAKASLFAVTNIALFGQPVSRSAIRADPRLADIEAIKTPVGSNPSFLTPEQAAAMKELAHVATRGVCPRCGNTEILHTAYGMHDPGAAEDLPPWVVFPGCVVPPNRTNRHCPECTFDWVAAEHL